MTTVSPEILKALKELDTRKAKLLELEKPLAIAKGLDQKFPDFMFSAPNITANERTGSAGWSDIQVFGMCATVQHLAPVLEHIAKEGWRQTAKPRDIPEMSARAWFCGPIMLLIILGLGQKEDDGKKCHYVEVGKKEVPIYELKCD